MKKIKTFLYVYRKSLTSLSYYKDILKTGFKFSLKYYLFLVLTMSLILSITLTIQLVPNAANMLTRFVESASKSYPDDLVVTIKNNEWSINKAEPLVFPFPQSEGDQPKNLLTLYKDGTINDIEKLDTMILINKINILARDRNGIKIYPLENLPDTSFDKSNFSNTILGVKNFAKWIPVLTFPLMLIGILFYYLILRTIYLSTIGLLIWIASKIGRLSISFIDSYRIGLHSMTLPITVSLITTIVGVNNLLIPGWFFLVNIGMAIAVIVHLSKNR